MRSIIRARFTMQADVLRLGGSETETPGHWDTYLDPITFEVKNVWIPGEPVDDPTTDVDETERRVIPCLVRGSVDGGVRLTGTQESFGEDYQNVEVLKMWVPADVDISIDDRITNISLTKTKKLIWKERNLSPTIFNVTGIVPLFDPFNNYLESLTLLQRASVQVND